MAGKKSNPPESFKTRFGEATYILGDRIASPAEEYPLISDMREKGIDVTSDVQYLGEKLGLGVLVKAPKTDIADRAAREFAAPVKRADGTQIKAWDCPGEAGKLCFRVAIRDEDVVDNVLGDLSTKYELGENDFTPKEWDALFFTAEMEKAKNRVAREMVGQLLSQASDFRLVLH